MQYSGKKYFFGSLIALMTALTVIIAFPTTAQAAQQSAGKTLYLRDCAFCHGADGRADTAVGRILNSRPRSFADPIVMARMTDEQIYQAIKNGKTGTAMASWGNMLTEPEIGDLIDFIHQFTSNAKKMDAKHLSLAVGKRIYTEHCADCHGLKGEAETDIAGVLKPRPTPFADPVVMARVDDGRMYAAIKLGLPGTSMASWLGLMSPVEVIDVMRYIRSLERSLPAGMTKDRLDITVGGNIYNQYCTTCHGAKGNANTALGNILIPHPRNFTNRKAMSKLSDIQLATAISHGKPGTAMAPWGGLLNTADILRVIRYIRTEFSSGQ